MEHNEEHRLLLHWLEKAEERMLTLEHRFQMENLALTGLRWAVSVAGAAAIVAVIQRALG